MLSTFGRIPAFLSLFLLAITVSCVVEDEMLDDETLDDETLDDGALGDESRGDILAVPGKGSATTLDIVAWNIEWFGQTSNGPSNETLQLTNVRDVISGADLDIWGVEEIVGVTHFNNLLAQLPGYAGILANDSRVASGSSYYGSSEQKVGIIYKTDVARFVSARIILTGYDYQFAGRPPLEVQMEVTINGTTRSLVFIVLHAKATNSTASWQRRNDASVALKAYLDSVHPTSRVFVVGDYNDDVDTSITSGKPSPYQNFVLDTADYRFPTGALSAAGISSTVSYSDMIDHHLATNELMADYIANSVEVYRVDQFISNYANTTSDHYPVLSRYQWGAATPGKVIVNEILANEAGSNTAGEFIEVVNVGGSSANLSGWTLSDGGGTRHTFASGTSLAPGQAIVVFASSSAIPAGLSNAVASSTGTLSLANGGDSVILKNSVGTVQDSLTYGSALSGTDGVSMNRNPDGNASGAFVLHTQLSALSRSPGTRSSGSAW
jgi:endonuclease/exonuclease/phosphatase family metal-dependent hydrolase